MKRAIIAALLGLATVAPVAAQVIRLDQQDGQLILEQQACAAGGRQATFIESRSNGGGAYGCWEAKDGYVYVRWTQFLGANGSILRANTVMRYDAPASLSGPTGKDKALIDSVDQLDDRCRGGSGDDPKTMKACRQRDTAMEQVRKAGWCWGPDEAISADKRWLRCK